MHNAALPFSKNPDQHPSFKLYFSKEWADAFFVTLHNFFSTLFACLPLPALLNFEAEHQKMQTLSTENHHLQMHLANTRQSLADAESTVQRLEAKLAQQEAKLAHQVANQAAGKRRYDKVLYGYGPDLKYIARILLLQFEPLKITSYTYCVSLCIV